MSLAIKNRHSATIPMIEEFDSSCLVCGGSGDRSGSGFGWWVSDGRATLTNCAKAV